MCGIFGGIGRNVNPAIIRALAIANKARGKDSLGFFDSSGKCVKRAGDPIALLAEKEVREFIDRRKSWFIAGHTRAATCGDVIDDNAHPFRYGRYIGAHNGIVSAPKRFAVDSQYLIHRLKKCHGDYQSAFDPVDGWWGLSWYDGADFYLQGYGIGIALGRAKSGTWYYSSDETHLEAAVGALTELSILEWGDTVKFDCKSREPEFLTPFWPSQPFYGDSGALVELTADDTADVDRKWEEWGRDFRAADFCDSWEEYCRQYNC
jgi:hypothetical protein